MEGQRGEGTQFLASSPGLWRACVWQPECLHLSSEYRCVNSVHCVGYSPFCHHLYSSLSALGSAPLLTKDKKETKKKKRKKKKTGKKKNSA